MDRRVAAVEEVERRLGHVFVDRALLDRALTHASASGGATKIPDNERLEFLGDRVLGLIIAEALLHRDAAASVGALSKALHVLVSGESCALVARSLGLGGALRLQGAHPKSSARENTTILADAAEALIAAHYIDAGLQRTTTVVLSLWAPLLDQPLDLERVNPKSELQEWAAANGRSQPVYRVLDRSGPDHRPLFTVEVAIADAVPIAAEGGSLRAAEKAAALALLRRERGAA